MHILVIEDDRTLQDGLLGVLQRAGHRVSAVADGRDADALLAQETFDLVVLDLGLPRLDGLTVLRRLRQRRATTPVLILSARDRAADRVMGLDAGADDYLDKPFERAEFEARVRALLRRGHNAATQFGGLTWSAETRQAWIDGADLNLTRNEAVILESLLQSPGRIMTKGMLAQRLGPDDRATSDNSVEVYIYRLRRKLAAAGVGIRTVRGLGYLLELLV